jgi:hypothetical protein
VALFEGNGGSRQKKVFRAGEASPREAAPLDRALWNETLRASVIIKRALFFVVLYPSKKGRSL